MQVKQLIEQQYPGVQVTGSNYPISAVKQAAAQAVSVVQMGGFAMVIFGDKVFNILGTPPPPFYTQNIANNRFGAGVGLWFVGNLIQNQLVSTGAFEVYYDGNLVGLHRHEQRTLRFCIDQLFFSLQHSCCTISSRSLQS